MENQYPDLISVSELLTETSITCPYCWESQEIMIDHTDEENWQVIDCQICCQPIVMQIQYEDDHVALQVERENV